MARPGLYANINARKKAGTSRSKKKSTISKKAYANMKKGFPKKKNVHTLMEEALRNGEDAKKIVEEFGWLKVRDGFSEPFTVKEIEKIKEELPPPQHYSPVTIPPLLQPLFNEVQELVFFRTARTDVFYELIFLSRPIFKKVAKLCQISFSELMHYPIQTLINGQPKKYNLTHIFACYQGEAYFSNQPLIKEEATQEVDFVNGRIAHKGVVVGTAKIVSVVSELDKVKNGDILITPMTFPSFISAMNRAAAFVTDEGGITCHAAIIAREMKKPCIIGTKIATKVFKDGDLVEVDADKGVVRKI